MREEDERKSILILTGYIEQHKDTCRDENCPLKQKDKKKKKKKAWEKEDRNDGKKTIFLNPKFSFGKLAVFEDSVNKLLLVIDQIYSNGTTKFKTSTKIRLAYAFFLMERRNDKKKALKQLQYAETLKPSFDEQVISQFHVKTR